jgi:SPP1 family predicted phage head-tail adaptor
MKSGRLRNVCSIRQRGKTQNALGQRVTSDWKTIATGVRTEVKTLSGRELEQAKKLHAEATVQVTTRDGRATVNDRFQYGTRLLEVAARIPNVTETEFVYLCSEHLD